MPSITRRTLMKQTLKTTAYVAPVVLAVRSAPVGAQVSRPCATTLTLTPASTSNVQFRNVVWSGAGFTPNGTVQIGQPTGFFALCRGIIIVPGTSITADAAGRFSRLMPMTAFSLSVVSGSLLSLTPPPPVQASATDATTGCASTVNFPLIPLGPAPSDSLTLLEIASPATSALAPPGVPVPGENGSGTVILGQHAQPQGGGGQTAELRFTLNGATPNRMFTLFITPSGSAAVSVGTVTSNAAGSATFATYIKLPGSNFCFGDLNSATLSLTIDGNAPGAANVAYQSALVRNNVVTWD
jgi:hypothetical protein